MTAMITITIIVGGITTTIIAARTAITITTIAGIIIITTTTTITIATMTINDVAFTESCAGVPDVDKLSLFLRFPDGVLRHEICTCRRSTC
jgi:hypothetical protein